SSSDSFVRSLTFTRRTATVTMSAPDASCAACMIWCVGYLPVPMISRDVNSRPAMMKGSIWKSGNLEIWECGNLQVQITRFPHVTTYTLSASSHQIHDFKLIAGLDGRRRVAIALEHDEVALDRNPARVDLEPREQVGDARRPRQLVGIAVELNGDHHGLSIANGASSARSCPPPSGRRCAGRSSLVVRIPAGRSCADAAARVRTRS